MMIGVSRMQLMAMITSVPSRTDSRSLPGVLDSSQSLGFEMMKRIPTIRNHTKCDSSPAIASTGRKSLLICHLRGMHGGGRCEAVC
jgi:hypothetical protein